MEKLLKKLFTNQKIYLVLIVILGFVLRFYQLGKVPSSLNRDEAAIGYNAYTILTAGKDEWGKRFPLTFKSFGDYKSPVYIYLTSFAVGIFGLNEFSVRFWGALSGAITVLIFYYLIQVITWAATKSKEWQTIPIAGSLLLALTPWHIFFSRFSYEANLALCFNSLILLIVFKYKLKKKNFGLSLLLLLTLFTYSSSLIIWPLFFGIFIIHKVIKIICQNKTKKNFNFLIWSTIILIILSIGILQQKSLGKQKGRVTIFGEPQFILDLYQKRTTMARQNPLKAIIFYNKYVYFGKITIGNYFRSFSFNFLFGGGGSHPWHKAADIPHFFIIYLPLVILGFFVFIWSKNIKKDNKILILLFLFISPLSSAITVDSPHATRLLNLFLILVFFSALGLGYCWSKQKIMIFVSLLIFLGYLIQFNNFYFKNYKENPPPGLASGLKEAIQFLQKNNYNEDNVIYNNSSDGAYIYWLFYHRYPLKDFLQQSKRYQSDGARLEWVEKIDNWFFLDSPQLNSQYREIFVLRGKKTLDQKIIIQIENEKTNEVYYTIVSNF